MAVEPVVPEQIHGFAVTIKIGPYPPDNAQSHRRAVYADLVPVSPIARERMADIGRARILGMAPLTPEGASEIEHDPDGRVAEHAATQALREAARMAKRLTR